MCTISLRHRFRIKFLYFVDSHADIPETCVRYVGAIVDDVIQIQSEVNTESTGNYLSNSIYYLLSSVYEHWNEC